jgi:hypothetical protein
MMRPVMTATPPALPYSGPRAAAPEERDMHVELPEHPHNMSQPPGDGLCDGLGME